MKILERTAEPLIVSDRSWEEFTLGYMNVLREGDIWRMWYGAYDLSYQYDCDSFLCYATSTDGVTWEKPELGIVEHNGSTKNNIVHDGRADRANVTTVFFDPQAQPSERYKGLAQKFLGFNEHRKGIWQCFGATSPDGLRWTMASTSHYPYNSDTQNVCFWDGGRYRQYMRLWRCPDSSGQVVAGTETCRGGMRTIGLSESRSFASFPVAEEILAPDDQDPTDMDFYTNSCVKLRDDLYVMFISCFYKKEDILDIQTAVSADGRRFKRTGREPLMRLTAGFDSKGIYVAPSAIPGEKPGTYWFYYLGTAYKHAEGHPSKSRHGAGIGRFLLEI